MSSFEALGCISGVYTVDVPVYRRLLTSETVVVTLTPRISGWVVIVVVGGSTHTTPEIRCKEKGQTKRSEFPSSPENVSDLRPIVGEETRKTERWWKLWLRDVIYVNKLYGSHQRRKECIVIVSREEKKNIDDWRGKCNYMQLSATMYKGATVRPITSHCHQFMDHKPLFEGPNLRTVTMNDDTLELF